MNNGDQVRKATIAVAVGRRLLAVVLAAGFVLAALTSSPSHTFAAPHGIAPMADTQPACASPAPGGAACAVVISGTALTTVSGYTPNDLRGAYGFQSSSTGMRQTVAVVTPYDDPAAEADLAAYRNQFGMPACTTGDGCFRKTDQNGGTNYPADVPGWSVPTALSVDMISAVCPNCHILLVEANSGGITDLGTAENTAASLGAKFITNTWYTPEATFTTAEPSDDTAYFDHPGVAITAPTGNNGFAVNYPAASPDVTAVGGTTLTPATSGSRGWTETAWSSTASGCSAYESKPLWQKDTGCLNRTVADVAAVADPDNSAVAFYDTATGGWVTGGGTTGSAAIIAATYALAGTPAASDNPAKYLYSPTKLLNDITDGANGTCSVTYLCTAVTGYDGPTGNGTPASTVPFTSGGSLTGAIFSGEPGMCLDDYNAGTADGNKIDVSTCNTLTRQNWTVETDGTIQVFGKCLDVHNGDTSDGTKVELDTCNGWARQQWRPYAHDALINPSSGKCLDDPNGSTSDGTQVDISTCNGWARQQWSLPYPVPTSTGPINSGAKSGMCAEDKDGSTSDGNTIWLQPCNGWARQSWTIEPDGTVQVLGVCMTDNGATSNGSPIQIHSCNGRDSQQWRIQSDGSLLNPDAGKCIDLASGSTSNGTKLVLETCDTKATTQQWILPPP